MDNSAVVVQYDVRQRNTAVENYREAADKAIDQLREELETLDQLDLQGGLRCEFMMAGDGNSEEFNSFLGRELFFCAHHAIHHNMIIKIIASELGVSECCPPDLGMAPSTINNAAGS